MPVKTERVNSHNVLAELQGTKHPDETVFFAAHWDAYGVGAPDAHGRTIRPGANDDGMGVAGCVGVGEGLCEGYRARERTLVFALWTAEERGLVGVGDLCCRIRCLRRPRLSRT